MNKNSVQDVTHTRTVEVRLAAPAPRVRYEKGKKVVEPAPDFGRVIRAIQEQVTLGVQAAYGTQTEVRVTEAKVSDIRLTGTFPEKAGTVRERVGGILSGAFEALDLAGE